jgi:peptidoglycan/xylan/chitin deacetylase (PgdA/CDA1 family)
MWNGKKKAITFSFDDGVLQDIRTIEILDKYGLKATFNLN